MFFGLHTQIVCGYETGTTGYVLLGPMPKITKYL
jgi:hypothetical protein